MSDNTYIPIPLSFFDRWNENKGFCDIQHAILDVAYLKASQVSLNPKELIKRWGWNKPGVRQRKLIDLAETIWLEIPELPIIDSDRIIESSKLSLYLAEFNNLAESIKDATRE